MEDTPQTRKKKSAHEYYLRNRERCIQQAIAYRLAHEEKYRAYQTEYFKNYKYTESYRRRLERQRLKRQQSIVVNPNPVAQQLPQPPPLLQPVETTVEDIQPSFTVLRPPQNKVFAVSFS